LLTASEVTALKLDADWVILSACNTAAGDRVGGDALSRLARAFFYAGARTLLVSHWYVDSDAAVALITKSFDALKTNPKIGRAEALRHAMSALSSIKSNTLPSRSLMSTTVTLGATWLANRSASIASRLPQRSPIQLLRRATPSP